MNDKNAAKRIVAKASNVPTSPRKLRLVADAIRNMEPLRAIDYLKVISARAAKNLLKVYQQALGNAKNNFSLSPADLKVANLQIEEGPRGPKRLDVHAHGARFDRGIRRKRMAHIKLELTQKEK